MSLPFLDLRSLLTFQQPGLLAFAVKIELTLCQPQLKVENNAHGHFFLTNLSGSVTITAGMQRLPIFQRSIEMRTLITALAVTAMLATSAVAKTPRTKEVRVQRNNAVSHNAMTRSPTQINSYCRFDRGTDPDPRIRLQLARDCREWELDHSE